MKVLLGLIACLTANAQVTGITWKTYVEQSGNWYGNNGYLSGVADPVNNCHWWLTNRGRIGGVTYDDSSIYSWMPYCYTTNSTWGTVGTFNAPVLGTTAPPSCNSDEDTIPGDRHPDKQFVLDTTRGWLWLWGGATGNGLCLDGATQTVTGNLVTGHTYNAIPIGSAGSWVGKELVVGSTIAAAVSCPIPAFMGSASTSSQIVLVQSDGVTPNTTCPQGAKFVVQKDLGNRAPRADMYRFDTVTGWHRVYAAGGVYPDNRNTGASVYDAAHNVIIAVGSNGGSWTTVWVFAYTGGAALSAVQIAAGATVADGWTQLANGAHGGFLPPNGAGVGLARQPMGVGFVSAPGGPYLYDSDTNATYRSLWKYDVGAKVWTKLCASPCTLPLGDAAAGVAGTNLVVNPNDGRLYTLAYSAGWHAYAYDPAIDAWSALAWTGTVPNGFAMLSFDAVTNRIIAKLLAAPTSRLYEGLLQ